LRILSAVVFALTLVRFVFYDTPWGYRAPFTPVLNRYYLGTLALGACLAATAHLFRRMDANGTIRLLVSLAAVAVVWLGSSVEAYSYFDSQAVAITQRGPSETFEAARSFRWAGQLALSVLWSVFAGLMTAAGFRQQERAWRISGLVLFALTLVKVVFVDISELRQFYRIVALLALGLVLMGVAWAYQRTVRREQAR
jgi:uncharacterized membrane protein